MSNPDNTDLSHLLFVSHSTYPLGHVSDMDIMRVAARNNKAAGISGILLRGETWFSQVLEGPASALAAAWESISIDPRHSHIRYWQLDDLEGRAFAGWHTEQWGVSPQIQAVLHDMLQSPDVSPEDKISFLRAFGTLRRMRLDKGETA